MLSTGIRRFELGRVRRVVEVGGGRELRRMVEVGGGRGGWRMVEVGGRRG